MLPPTTTGRGAASWAAARSPRSSSVLLASRTGCWTPATARTTSSGRPGCRWRPAGARTRSCGWSRSPSSWPPGGARAAPTRGGSGARLAAAAKDAAGVKTIIAYRSGFDIDLSRPDEVAVRDAASRWIDATQPAGGGGPARLDDQVLLRFGLHAAVDLGLPIQVHTGLGDRDLDLHKVNPLLLLDFLRIPEVAEVPVVLLHCYPYHREAGYLAQAFHNVYFDVGLSVNFLGARSLALVAESFELAPFAKQL